MRRSQRLISAWERDFCRTRSFRAPGNRNNGEGNSNDERFASAASTRAFIDNLQSREHDQPLTLIEDLRILTDAGLKNASVFWLEYREAVTGASNRCRGQNPLSL